MRPTATGMASITAWEDMRNASTAARQAAGADWPDGPTEYGELFQWHKYHAGVLLSECKDAEAHRKNLAALLHKGIVHSDAFSGLGTASITLKQQMQSMQMFLAGLEGCLLLVAISLWPVQLNFVLQSATGLFRTWVSAIAARWTHIL